MTLKNRWHPLPYCMAWDLSVFPIQFVSYTDEEEDYGVSWEHLTRRLVHLWLNKLLSDFSGADSRLIQDFLEGGG